MIVFVRVCLLRYYIIDPGKNLSCSITAQNLILINVLDDQKII